MIALGQQDLVRVCGGYDWRAVRKAAAGGAIAGTVGGVALGSAAGAGVFSIPGAAIGGVTGAAAGALTGAVGELSFQHWVVPAMNGKRR